MAFTTRSFAVGDNPMTSAWWGDLMDCQRYLKGQDTASTAVENEGSLTLDEGLQLSSSGVRHVGYSGDVLASPISQIWTFDGYIQETTSVITNTSYESCQLEFRRVDDNVASSVGDKRIGGWMTRTNPSTAGAGNNAFVFSMASSDSGYGDGFLIDVFSISSSGNVSMVLNAVSAVAPDPGNLNVFTVDGFDFPTGFVTGSDSGSNATTLAYSTYGSLVLNRKGSWLLRSKCRYYRAANRNSYTAISVRFNATSGAATPAMSFGHNGYYSTGSWPSSVAYYSKIIVTPNSNTTYKFEAKVDASALGTTAYVITGLMGIWLAAT